MGTQYAGADSFPATVFVLDDGDDAEALSWDVTAEGTLDRTTWLKNRLNSLFYYDNDTNSGGDPLLVETFAFNTIGTTWTKSTLVFVDIAGCAVSDQFIAKLHIGGVSLAGGGGVPLASYRLYRIQDFGGGGAVQSAVPQSHGMLGDSSWSADRFQPIASIGRGSVTVAGTLRIGLEVRLRTSSAGFQMTVYSGIELEVQRLKA